MFNISSWMRQQTALPLDLPLPKIAKLPSGDMEYVVYGSGKPLLIIHGGVGGYDQSLVLFRNCIPDGYQLICPSRPGYVGTPLSTGASIEAQADALAELLDYLEIPEITLLGMSAGGMVLYSFAIRHAAKTKAIIAINAIAGEYLLPEQMSKFAHSFFMTDLGLWFTKESLIYFPEMTIKKFINSSGAINQDLIDKRVADILHSQPDMKLISEIMYLMADYRNREAGTLNDLANGSKLSWFPFEKITAPALIIHGTHDSEVRFHHGVFAYEGLGSAIKERVWVEYGTHFGFFLLSQCGDSQDKLRQFIIQYA